jgi:hypothetical protein
MLLCCKPGGGALKAHFRRSLRAFGAQRFG